MMWKGKFPKHIEVDHHFIHEHDEAERITIPCISSELQIVDLFTKVMLSNRQNFLVSKLMLLDDTHQFEGECEESFDSNTPVEHDISTNLCTSR